MEFKSGNPVLSEKRFSETVLDDIVRHENAMTIRGTINKFGFLFLMMLGTAYYAWTEFIGGGNVWTLIIISVFGSLAVGLVLAFKQQWSPFLAPAYALLQGLFVGSVSAYFEYRATSADEGDAVGYSGIVLQAVGLTFAVVIAMYLLYSFRIIQATKKFKAVIITATVALGLFYFVCWILILMKISVPSFLFQGSALGIGFSIFVVALAALNFILDFDMIERGVEAGAPKYMEWYGAFGLLVTIVWLYLEILRLLAKLSGRK